MSVNSDNPIPVPEIGTQDAAPFEETYFQEIYGAAYDRRNPRYKHRSYLRELTRYVKGGTLLDVGCAYGAFLREASERFDCTGTDISHHAVSVAAKRVPQARFVVSDLVGLQTDQRFDAVTCLDVLEHVPELDAGLARIRTLLKPGGTLMMVVPTYDTWVGKLVELVDRDPTHVHKWARRAWLERLNADGFEVVAWKGIMRIYLGGPIYLHLPTRLLRGFSPAILIAARPRA